MSASDMNFSSPDSTLLGSDLVWHLSFETSVSVLIPFQWPDMLDGWGLDSYDFPRNVDT
jgi:hypothetical protein